MTKKLELLLPAWDFEKLKYAYAYWADACYVGAPMFSLRARTNAFTMKTLKEAVEYAHNLDKKIYFTANIYAHNVKIKPFLAQFKKMVEMNPDAFIMSDPWLIHLVKKDFPDVEIHLSVQANNTNWAQAEFWQTMGIKRIILSREISLKEMAEIHEKVPEMELEAFVHWAICMAYSGRCLLSNYLSNRDPNQGTCSHSCRWEYKVYKEKDSYQVLKTPSGKVEEMWETGRPKVYETLEWAYYLEEKERPGEFLAIDEDEYWTYIMNSRDLCAVDYLEDLKKAWIISFKVEWRNKTINYLASVWRVYKKVLEAVELGKDYDVNEAMQELFSIANRWYIPGFLAWNPWANAQFYERNGGFQTELFIWPIREYDEEKGLAKVEVKNIFEVWDTLKIITPDDIWEQKIEKIYRIVWTNRSDKEKENFEGKLEEVEKAHWGSFDVWINMDKNPGIWAIVRKNVEGKCL